MSLPSPLAALAAPSDSDGVAALRPALEFESLYREHFAFVWRSLGRLGLAPDQLDDAAQEVFLVVHRRLSDFDGRVSLRSWLFGIAHKVCLNHRRSRRRRAETTLLPGEPSSQGADPQRCAETHEDLEFLERFLDALDDHQRAVFVLAELEQMSAPEIADSLQMNLNTVYSRLRLGRASFRHAIERRQGRLR